MLGVFYGVGFAEVEWPKRWRLETVDCFYPSSGCNLQGMKLVYKYSISFCLVNFIILVNAVLFALGERIVYVTLFVYACLRVIHKIYNN